MTRDALDPLIRAVAHRAANRLARQRRDLRIVLTARYRRLLATRTRSVVLAAFAAGLVDRAGTLAHVARGVGDPRVRLADTVARLRSRRGGGLLVVRAAVGGVDELSLTLAGGRPELAAVDGVRLSAQGRVVDLPATVSLHTTARLATTVPAGVLDGADWTVCALAGAREVALTVASRQALATRPGPPDDAHWPPRPVLTDQRRLALRGRAPGSDSLVHSVAVGVRSVVVRWQPVGPAELRLAPVVTAADGSTAAPSTTVDLVVAAVVGADGTARAVLDLTEPAAVGSSTWAVFAVDDAGRRPLGLPRGSFPRLDSPGEPMTTVVRRADGTAVAVEVGYSTANQLTVFVGPREPRPGPA